MISTPLYLAIGFAVSIVAGSVFYILNNWNLRDPTLDGWEVMACAVCIISWPYALIVAAVLITGAAIGTWRWRTFTYIFAWPAMLLAWLRNRPKKHS